MDETLLLMINQGWAHPWLDEFFLWITGRGSFSYPLTILLLLYLSLKYRRDGAFVWMILVLSVLAGDAIGAVLKDLFAQPRPCFEIAELVRIPGYPPMTPCGSSLTGMPSNHALDAFLFATFLSVVFPHPGWRITTFSVAILIGLSRIYLAKHYPGQVLSGAVIGMILGLLAAKSGLRYCSPLKRVHRLQESLQ